MNTQPKHRPILFSTDMVRAILKGHKTQTRRIMKPQPTSADIEKITDWATEILPACPFGKVGDILWVRETIINTWQTSRIPYRADVCSKYDLIDGTKWIPSIFMPRAACRIFLKITNIRVEKLQDINDHDCKAEGIKYVIDKITGYCGFNYLHGGYNLMTTPYKCYKSLWEKINGTESWDANPYVWVIKFEQCDKPANF